MSQAKIAVILRLNPNKFGSLEEWMVEFAHQAAKRNLGVDFYTGPEILPEIRQQLTQAGAGWYDIEQASASTIGFIRRFSKYKIIHLNLFGIRDRIPLLSYMAIPARVLFVDHLSRLPGIDFSTRPRIKKLVDRFSIIRVYGIAGVSNFITESSRARFKHCINQHTIYNGVNSQRFIPGQRHCDPPQRIACTAHLIPEKGVDVLIEAFAQLQNANLKLTIIGTGPQRAELETLANKLGVASQVEFLGAVSQVQEVLETADIFVHPAKWQEAFGLGIVEAMACGLPVIASNLGAAPEIIDDGISGILTKPGDASTLARILQQLILAPELRNKLGSQAREKVEKRFKLSDCVKQHLDWCESSIKI